MKNDEIKKKNRRIFKNILKKFENNKKNTKKLLLFLEFIKNFRNFRNNLKIIGNVGIFFFIFVKFRIFKRNLLNYLLIKSIIKRYKTCFHRDKNHCNFCVI